jgi:phage-related protein
MKQVNPGGREGKIIEAEFFQYENGTRPVREWLLNELTEEERKFIGRDIGTVEFEWPVGPPLVKKVGDFWEVRTVLKRGWSRVFFIVEGSRMILIHGVIKKSRKVRTDDIDVAVTRLKLLRSRQGK